MRPLFALALLAPALAGCFEPPAGPAGDREGGAPVAAFAWDLLPENPAPRTESAAIAIDGRVYVVGGIYPTSGETPAETGTRIDVLDLATGAWSTGPPLPVGLHHVGLAALGSRLVVVGGYVSPSFSPTALSWELDTANPSAGWQPFPQLPASRGAHAVASDGERIWVFGGFTGQNALVVQAGALATETLVFEDGAWRAVAEFPGPREHLAGAYLDGKVYAVGGRAFSFATNTGRFDVYDPAADAWSVAAPLPTARGGLGAATLAGLLVAVGGEGPDGTFDEVEAFDPATGAWRALPPLPQPRHGVAVASAGDALVVVGGGPEPSFTFSGTTQRLRTVR